MGPSRQPKQVDSWRRLEEGGLEAEGPGFPTPSGCLAGDGQVERVLEYGPIQRGDGLVLIKLVPSGIRYSRKRLGCLTRPKGLAKLGLNRWRITASSPPV
jgi:hypothetical protein